jgi:tRNA pseudouridine38-40 synthase
VPTYKLTVAYDGTGYVGWQRQASGTSIQGLLEDALSDLDGRPVPALGAGRTDAGVHARGQVVGASLDRDLAADAVVRALNVRLPPAVRVVSAVAVASTFHARFDARAKTYQYRIWNAPVADPFERAYAWHVPEPLDVVVMDSAARLLEGEHDFTAFCAAETDTLSTRRVVMRSSVRRQAPQLALVTYDVSGSGFLRHMVRTIVGTIVEVGLGRQPVEWLAEVLASEDRRRAGRTAPPHGLCLIAVQYGEDSLPPAETSL